MATVTVKQKNVERLIARCEGLVSGKAQFKGKEWKLSKVSNGLYWSSWSRDTWSSPFQYVAALCEQIKELEKYPR